MNTASIQQAIITEAERCVMCGLCLPHCPTYLLTHDENDSPRGRISLMKTVADGRFDLTPRLQSHLDHCLLCRACETACPSGVHFGQLMDDTRQMLFQDKASRRKTSVWLHVFLNAAVSKSFRQLLHWLLYLYQRTGIRWLAQKSGLLVLTCTAQLDALLPPVSVYQAWQSYYAPDRKKQGDVALFTGCIANIFDQQTLHATISVLNHLGYGVHVPEQQVCCGALHQHQGDIQQARQLSEENIRVFSTLDVERVIVIASGCESNLLENFKPESGFPHDITDISSFLLEVWSDDLYLKPVGKKLAIHVPCTQKLVPNSKRNTIGLLSRISGLELHSLSDNPSCCGAAGSHMLEYPKTANQLSLYIVQQLKDIQPDILLTSNMSCGLHIAASTIDAGMNIEILHPVSLIARQLLIHNK